LNCGISAALSMLSWINKYPVILLIAILAFLFLAGDGIRIIQYPPRTIHIFRQSDCLAYTKTYYQNNSGFFSPACYNLIGKDGKVVSEFPVMYYISAKLCQLFGFHYWIIRGLTLLSYLVGLLYLFKICRIWINDAILAIFPVVILGCSPYFFFYAVNFLPNVPAISFSFVGLYYMLAYGRSKRNLDMLLATTFFTVSALLKPTDGGLIWACYGAVLLLNFLSARKDKKVAWPVLLSFAAVALFSALWLFFVKEYNNINGNKINLQGFYPIWDMSTYDIITTFTLRLVGLWLDNYQHPVLLIVSVFCFVVFIWKWRSLDRFLRLFTVLLLLGALVYTPLWYKAFGVHDYYILIYTIPAVFLFITVATFFDGKISNGTRRPLLYSVYTVLAGLMVVGIYHNQAIQLDRYSDKNVGFSPVEIYELEPYLRKIGVKPSDIVFTVPDGSPNISLAAYGNPGFASDLFGVGTYTPQFAIDHGAKYMIINQRDFANQPAYKPYTSKLIGSYKGIDIYDLR
jgi:hypothetical protein